jgi:acyl-CoA synthetase (AMP-forming)/AMP-acid ligase II
VSAAKSGATTDILAAVLDACAEHPGSPAVSFGGSTLTYGELRDRVLAASVALRGGGMVRGDRVLFSVRPGIEATFLALGIIAAGGVVVFADPGAGEAMFRARAELAAARWVAAESLLYFASSGPLRGIARRRGIVLPPYRTVVPEARHIFAGRWLPGVPSGAIAVRRLAAGAGAADAGADDAGAPDLGDPSGEALIIFTSGTTADPKAVVHSRLSLGTGLADFAHHTQLRAGDVVLTDQLMVGIPALIAGAHWMLPASGTAPGAGPAGYFALLAEADVMFAVPATLDAVLTLLEADPGRATKLRTVLIGGAPVLRPLLERVRTLVPNAAVRAIYGMTEVLPVAIADGIEKLEFTGDGDYVGQIASSVGARIQGGELMLSGPGLMLGYLGKAPITELATGDRARIEGNRLVLTGRGKDMFIRGTTNVYPGLYEPAIAGLPGLRDVAMIGVPDPMGDDRVVIVVVPTDPPTGLTDSHPALGSIGRALPGLIDTAVLPDVLLAAGSLPRSGRAHKLDRAALTEQVRSYLA